MLCLAQFECEVTLRQCGHCRIEEPEHRHDTADHIVDPVVNDSETGEDHPAGEQPHSHREQHPDIEQSGVLRYSFVINGVFKRWLHQSVIYKIRGRLQNGQTLSGNLPRYFKASLKPRIAESDQF